MVRRAVRLMLTVAVVGSLFAVVPVTAAIAASGGLTIRADTTYDIVTEEGLVDVTSDITVTNVTPDKRSGNTITQYYYYAFSVPIPVEAENVAATSGGRNLTVTVTEGEDGVYDVAEIRLRSRLYYKQTHTLALTFDFVGAEPRSEESGVRVNNAFVWFYAWAFGDANRSSVTVLAPRGLDIEITGQRMQETTGEDGRRRWVATDISDPYGWFVTVNGWAEGRLASSGVTVDDNYVSVRYWPGDVEWRDDVVEAVEAALPALVETLGLGWPVEDQLVIRETIVPTVFGYAGWYLLEDDDIEIGETVDRETVVHEISHAWFNDDLFDSRWINEGLAQAVTELVLLDTFGERTFPDLVEEGDAGYRKLNTWGFPSDVGTVDDDTEYYSYNASWIVVGEVLDEIGEEGLREVLAAAVNDEIAYRGAGAAESVDATDDWRRFLDLVEERGGAESLLDLFTEYVVRTADADLLIERQEARAAYAELVDAGGDWSPSILIRQPMADWEFEAAMAHIDAAGEVLAAAANVDAQAAALGLNAAATVEPVYETVRWSFNGALATLDDRASALSAIARATAAVTADRDDATVAGLEGLDPDAELAAARTAFEADDLDAAALHAALAVAMIEDAPVVGQARLDDAARQQTVIVGLGVLALMCLAAGLLLRRLRKRRAIGAPAAEAVVDDPLYGPPSPRYGPPTPVGAGVGAHDNATADGPEPPSSGSEV